MIKWLIAAESMSIPPPVKTALSIPRASGELVPVASETPATPEPPEPNPTVAALLRVLRPPPEPRVHQEAESRLPLATKVEISLAECRLRVRHHEDVLVETPVALGRTLSPTPEGSFTLAAKPDGAPSLRYGHFRTRSGALLMRGVFPKIDVLPPDAVFDPIAPKGVMVLSDGGPLVFGGEATGAATSDGTVVMPDRIALMLHEKLPLGLPVVISR
jgi:hypothetical protein